ncbi:hypothetical protein Tcan_01529, partial [Toxocara canis]
MDDCKTSSHSTHCSFNNAIHVYTHNQNTYAAFELGPRFRPGPLSATFTKRRLYWMRRAARQPVFFFFFSCLSTFGVWARTFPARANEPNSKPPISRALTFNDDPCIISSCERELLSSSKILVPNVSILSRAPSCD